MRRSRTPRALDDPVRRDAERHADLPAAEHALREVGADAGDPDRGIARARKRDHPVGFDSRR